MKKLILLFAVLFVFASCEMSRYLLTSNYIDYSTVCKNKDFFITESNSVSFNYKALGSISVECVSGNSESTTFENGFESSTYKLTSIEDAFKELFKVVESKGANGVINLQSRFIGAYSIGGVAYESRWIVTGMLIIK